MSQKQKVESNLDNSRESYLPGDAQIVSLEKELDNINIQIEQVNADNTGQLQASAANDNLYEKLRSQLTLEEVEKNTLMSRVDVLQKLLSVERGKIDSDQNKTFELDNTEQALKDVLLKKQEIDQQLRKSKTLKRELIDNTPALIIEQSPSLPESYRGMGFIEFLMIGPLLSFLLPLSIASLIVALDSRVRTVSQLSRSLPQGVMVMGVVPHYDSPQTARIFRRAVLSLLMWMTFVFCMYITVGVIGLRQ